MRLSGSGPTVTGDGALKEFAALRKAIADLQAGCGLADFFAVIDSVGPGRASGLDPHHGFVVIMMVRRCGSLL